MTSYCIAVTEKDKDLICQIVRGPFLVMSVMTTQVTFSVRLYNIINLVSFSVLIFRQKASNGPLKGASHG